jgi:Family of unknown function (DUF5761)
MSWPLFKQFENQHDSFADEALKGNVAKTELSSVFFSNTNVNALHEAIRYQVYVKSEQRHIIDRQSDIDLKIVMRSVFLQYSKNLPYDIVGQIRELNSIIIDFCVDKILNEINMYLYYKQDIDKVPEPMARSVNTSSAGTKTLFMKDF